MPRAWVAGNGPSLLETPLELLKGERVYAVNHIWRMFDRTSWRPTDYVRGELPEYDEEDMVRDLLEMRKYPVRIRYQKGFEGRARYLWNQGQAQWGEFKTCKGQEHPWHLPEICGFGTVVTTAIQIAVMDGATEIYLLGCDLGNRHFHEGAFQNSELALRAHEIANKCCPVPIVNCTPGGELEVYPRRTLADVVGERQ